MNVADGDCLHPDQRVQLKRMAIDVVALLPQDEREALIVLTYARELVIDWLGDGQHKVAHLSIAS